MTVELLTKACSNCIGPFFRFLMRNGREQLAVQSSIRHVVFRQAAYY